MDETDRLNLILAIMGNVNKRTEDGHCINLTAEETVAYAKVLTTFIDGEEEEEDDEFRN